MNNTKTKTEELLKFATDYNKILVDTVLPGLKPFENERKFKQKLAIISSIFFTVVAIIIFIFVPGRAGAELGTLSLVLAATIWAEIKKRFENKLKKTVMPHLMQAFPGFQWQDSPTITSGEVIGIHMFSNALNADKTYDDAFCGKFQEVDIDITECSYSTGGKHKITIFSGAIIRLKMNKNFKGITIVRPKNCYQGCKDLERLKLEEVKLEDVEFCKNYRVFSTDQIEARYLLTTSFMDRFKNMKFSFNSDSAYCVFCNKYVYIAPETTLDLFNLFELNSPVSDRKQFDVMFNQIYSILRLVEHFKLTQKTGL